MDQILKPGKDGSVSAPNLQGLMGAGKAPATPKAIGKSLDKMPSEKAISPGRFMALKKISQRKIV